jgi:hypothetical protein
VRHIHAAPSVASPKSGKPDFGGDTSPVSRGRNQAEFVAASRSNAAQRSSGGISLSFAEKAAISSSG